MNLLNRAVYGAAFRRHDKRLRVLPVLEKGEVRARVLPSWERGKSGRCIFIVQLNCPRTSMLLPLKALSATVGRSRVGYGRILFRDGANAGWINYVLKDRQKSEFELAFATDPAAQRRRHPKPAPDSSAPTRAKG
jgi:hypothetical protein